MKNWVMEILLKNNNLSSSLFLSHLPCRNETIFNFHFHSSSSFHLTEYLKIEYKTLIIIPVIQSLVTKCS